MWKQNQRGPLKTLQAVAERGWRVREASWIRWSEAGGELGRSGSPLGPDGSCRGLCVLPWGGGKGA